MEKYIIKGPLLKVRISFLTISFSELIQSFPYLSRLTKINFLFIIKNYSSKIIKYVFVSVNFSISSLFFC